MKKFIILLLATISVNSSLAQTYTYELMYDEYGSEPDSKQGVVFEFEFDGAFDSSSKLKSIKITSTLENPNTPLFALSAQTIQRALNVKWLDGNTLHISSKSDKSFKSIVKETYDTSSGYSMDAPIEVGNLFKFYGDFEQGFIINESGTLGDESIEVSNETWEEMTFHGFLQAQ